MKNVKLAYLRFCLEYPRWTPTPLAKAVYLDVRSSGEHTEGHRVGVVVDGGAHLPEAADDSCGKVVSPGKAARMQAVDDGDAIRGQPEQLHLPEHLLHELLQKGRTNMKRIIKGGKEGSRELSG